MNHNLWIYALGFSPYADWFAFRLVSRTYKELSTRSQRLYVWQRPREWLCRLLQARGFHGERFCHLLQRDRHFLAGSFVLWALMCPSTWVPKDADVFAMATWMPEGKISQQEYSHFTPFVHDLFDFERPFFTDEEMQTLPRGLHPQRGLEERLECIQKLNENGYELFPILARTYQIVAGCQPNRTLFDYVVVLNSGLDQKTIERYSLLPTLLASLVYAYVAPPAGYTSVHALFEAACDVRFCQTLFDGTRLHVQDWDALWTRSSVVNVDTIAIPCPTREKQARLWVRTIHRVSKYRDRNFAIDLQGDTSCLIPKLEEADDDGCSDLDICGARTRRRRYSFPFCCSSCSAGKQVYQDRNQFEGLLSKDRNWSRTRPWRPTARLLRQAAVETSETRKWAENKNNVDDYSGKICLTTRSEPASPRSRANVLLSMNLQRLESLPSDDES